MHSFASLITRNSLRSRRRSVLTIVSIAVAFCMMGVLMAMYHLFFLSEPAGDQALRLVVRNKISFAHPMPVYYLDKIKAIPGVRDVMIQQFFSGTYKHGSDTSNNFARFGVEPEKLFRMHPEYEIESWQAQHFIERRDSCLLGRELAKRLELKLGDRITLQGDVFPATLNLVVAGIYDSAIDNELLYFHNEYLNESLTKNKGYTILFMVLVDNAESAATVGRRIDNAFRNAPVATKTETEKTFRLKFLSYLGNIKLFLFVVCASLAGTVFLVATNSIAISVRERSQEVGIMKAIGFSAHTVMWLITSEAMFMGCIGGLVGIGGAEVIIRVIRDLPVEAVTLTTLSLSPGVTALILALAALCGMVAAMPAAWQASRRSITECLAQAD